MWSQRNSVPSKRVSCFAATAFISIATSALLFRFLDGGVDNSSFHSVTKPALPGPSLVGNVSTALEKTVGSDVTASADATFFSVARHLKHKRSEVLQLSEAKTHQLAEWRRLSGNPVVRPSETLKGSWFTHENVCVNSEDGSTRYWSEDRKGTEVYESSMQQFGLMDVTQPFIPVYVNFSALRDQQLIHHLRGTTVLAQCWRNSHPNPVHFFFAVGRLFNLFSQNNVDSVRIDHIVLHQCGDPYMLGEFFEVVWTFLWQLGLERSYINVNTSLFAADPLQEDGLDLFCMDAVEVEYSLWFAGTSGKEFKQLFTKFLRNMLPAEAYVENTRLKRYIEGTESSSRSCSECSAELRFGLYERPVTDGNRRLVHNKDDVFGLFQEFSRNIAVVSVDRESNITEIYKQFNSFDILVSTYGSHMQNFIFTESTNFAVIDVWGAEIFPLGDWNAIVPYYKESFPHVPVDPELRAITEKLVGSVHSDRELRTRIQNSDLIVDLTLLRAELRHAVERVCSCQYSVEVSSP